MSPRIFQRRPVQLAARERLLDEAFERYLDWRAESDELDRAYGAWSQAPLEESAFPFAAYAAALDREERAATLYSTVIDRLERLADEVRELAAAGPRAA